MGDKMWVSLMHLSDNMWVDTWRPYAVGRYYEELSLDEKVWKETIDFLPTQGFNTVLIDVGDALQYDRHPEISIKGAWSKDRLKAELDRMRSLGLTPIPKLNFSSGHDIWLKEYSRMLSTSIYYQVCKDVIEEVAEVFGNPALFHLGLDEEDAKNQGGYQYCVVRQHDLWWHDAYYLFDLCEKLGARPWVWADKMWHETETYLEKMPKSVLQSNWVYEDLRKNPDGSYRQPKVEFYRTLNEAGYDQIPCTSTFYGNQYSAVTTMLMGKEELNPDQLLGYMTASWRNARTMERYTLLNDAYQFGIAKKTVYPDE